MRPLRNAFARVLRTAFAAGIAVLLSNSIAVWAAFSSNSAGTSGAAFLKLGVGSRAVGMGEAFSAVANDVNAIYYNTAGLGQIREKNEFVGMRANLFEDITYNYFSFAHPTQKWGTWALGIQNLSVTNIEQRSGDTDNPDSTFSSNDTAYTAAYGQKVVFWGLPDLSDQGGLYLGSGLKFIRQTLGGEQANSVAVDLGSLYKLQNYPISFSLAMQNIGTKPKFKTVSDPLPLTIKAGVSTHFGERWMVSGVKQDGGDPTGLTVGMDLHAPRDNDPTVMTGFEFSTGWTENIQSTFRAGYRADRARQVNGSGSGVAAGAGLRYKFLTFDFAWQPYGELGNTYRYSVRVRF